MQILRQCFLYLLATLAPSGVVIPHFIFGVTNFWAVFFLGIPCVVCIYWFVYEEFKKTGLSRERVVYYGEPEDMDSSY